MSQRNRWYALNVVGNKVMQLQEILQERGVETYTPTVERLYTYGQRQIRRRVPAIPRLLFIRCDEDFALEFEREAPFPFRLYRTLESDFSKRSLIVIPEERMRMFIAVSSSGEEGLEYISYDASLLVAGRKVRINQGPLAGMEGYIKRIKGNRRFIVEVEGICMVAMHYIPAAFLTPI